MPLEVLSCFKCTNGNKVTIEFSDRSFTFHSQWLHDARCDDGASRNATTALCQQPTETVRVDQVEIENQPLGKAIKVVWTDGITSHFPIEWLRVIAPIVASQNDNENPTRESRVNSEWMVRDLAIPEISYNDIFSPVATKEQFDKLSLEIIDHLLSPYSTGLIKIFDLPAPNMEDELKHINNLNTIVLKKLFGSVFVHPLRGMDKTFAVSTRGKEQRQDLPNYDPNQVLLPHTDHTFYHTAAQVQGWYCLEGESENTFVSVPAVLRELNEKHPDMYRHLSSTPLAFGRQNSFYGPTVVNTTTDTAITTYPASDEFKSFRWHPNLVGSLCCKNAFELCLKSLK